MRDGADEVIDSEGADWVAAVQELTGGVGVDVVFDPVGGDVFRQSVGCLAYGGRLLAIGFASGEWGSARTQDLVNRNATVMGAIAVPPDEATATEMRQQLAAWYEKGALDPRVTRVASFEEVPRLLIEVEERRAVGKLVVRVSDTQ